MRIKIIFLIVVTVFSSKSYSQTEIDSLLTRLRSSSGINKVDVLNRISDALRLINSEISRDYALQASILSDSLNYTKGKGYADQNLVFTAYLSGDFKTAIENNEHALRVADELNDIRLKKRVCEVLALIYEETAAFDKSLEYFQLSYDLNNILDNPVGMGLALMGAARVYETITLDQLSLKSNLGSLIIFENLGNEIGIAKSLIAVAKNYFLLERQDSSFYYFKKAEDLIHNLNSKELLLELYLEKNHVYSEHSIDSSLFYIGRAIDLAKDLGQLYLKRDLLLQASELHSNRGEYQLAYDFYQLYSHLNDSLLNLQESINPGRLKLTLSDAIYTEQLEVLDRYANMKNLESGRNNLLVFGFGGIVVCLSAVMIWLVFRYNNQRKSKEKMDILYNEITTLSEEITKKEETIRIIKGNIKNQVRNTQDKDAESDQEIEIVTEFNKEITQTDFNDNAFKKFISVHWQELKEVRDKLQCDPEFPDLQNISREKWGHLNLDTLLGRLIQLNDKTIKGRINIHYRPDPAVNLYCHKESVLLMIHCMFRNAIESIEDKGDIFIDFYVDEKKITIRFMDTGKGIKEDDRLKIFNPLFSTKKTGGHPGLGLTVSREVIRIHEAVVKVKSIPGKGTEFSLEFYYPLRG
jgi:hypothetical protein